MKYSKEVKIGVFVVSVLVVSFFVINYLRGKDIFTQECLKQFAAIAETGLPIHFHTGILFDHYASSEFVRPIAYECLLNIKNIRFALAHVGNPWVDEYILLYAKFQAAMNNVPGERKLRMFIDLTPGVTRLRRKDMLRMLFLSGYANPANDILWGSDNRINNYIGCPK